MKTYSEVDLMLRVATLETALRDSNTMLAKYAAYGEAMREHGRGYVPTSDDGQTPEGRIALNERTLAKSVEASTELRGLLGTLEDLADQYDRLFAAWSERTNGEAFGWGKLGTHHARQLIAKLNA